MNFKNCSHITNYYLKKDNDQKVSLKIRIHLLFCSKCRKEFKVFISTINSFAESAPFSPNIDLSDQIMTKINTMPVNYHHDIPIWQWILPGLFITLGTFTISLTDTMIWIKNNFGSSFEVPLNIVFGLIISIYPIVVVLSIFTRMKNFFLASSK